MVKKLLLIGLLIVLIIVGVMQFGGSGKLASSILGTSSDVQSCTEQWYQDNTSKLTSSITNSAEIQKKIDAIASDILTKQDKARQVNLEKAEIEANYTIRKDLFDKAYLTRTGFNRFHRLCENPRGYYVEPCKEYTKAESELEALQKKVEDLSAEQKTFEANFTTIATEKATLQKNLDDTLKFVTQMQECATKLSLPVMSSEVRPTSGSGNSSPTSPLPNSSTPSNSSSTSPLPNPSTPSTSSLPPSSTPPQYSCTDSDGGADITKIGSVVIKKNGVEETVEGDLCDYKDAESYELGIFETTCKAPNGNSADLVKTEYITCQYGCVEDKCMTQAEQAAIEAEMENDTGGADDMNN